MVGLALLRLCVPNTTIDPSKLANVTRGDLDRSVVATGKIEPLVKVEVKSKASGIVEKIRGLWKPRKGWPGSGRA